MRKLLVLLALAFLLASTAGGMCPYPRPRLLCAEYYQSDAVVTARLLKIRHVTKSDDDDYMLYTMRTEHASRGNTPATFTVIDTIGSGRTLIHWEKGHRYLLFLSYMKDSKAWALDSCGFSDELDKAPETKNAIDQLQTHVNGGTIYGSVWGNFEATVMANDVTVLAKGKQGTFKAVTDKEGNFKIAVPAGTYRVTTLTGNESRFEPDIWSYEDPKKLRVMNGGCAQVQFGPVEKSTDSGSAGTKKSPNPAH